jgi:NitT/TauT family transport system permease protein
MPGLVWNMLMSMSGGWFMLVAAEAVTVGNTTWTLPGIGSYVAQAQAAGDLKAIGWAILTMLIVILLYDQLLFRPLVAWSAKFRYEMTQGAVAEDPWMLAMMRRTALLRRGSEFLSARIAALGGLPIGKPGGAVDADKSPSRLVDILCLTLLACSAAYAVWMFGQIAARSFSVGDIVHVFVLGLYTLIRVLVMIALATLVWVPIGVWLGLRPTWARRAQPVAQFLAAFPANLFYPIFVLTIVHFALNPSIWLTPLMVLGTQWYILFNVIAGAAAFPADLLEAAANFRVGSLLWWRRVVLPGVFPYFVTGAITASGGSWNASILAEIVVWKTTTLKAAGLGAYIAQATTEGSTIKVVLGTVVMSGFVLCFNRFFWRPLYAYSSRRLTLA